jgi:cell division protein FtsX
MPPEMENELAMMVAQAMQQLAPQYKQQPQPDPLIQIEAEKVQQKAVSDQVKANVEMEKAKMVAQSEAADRETKETIAAMKLAADLQKQDSGSFGG